MSFANVKRQEDNGGVSGGKHGRQDMKIIEKY